MQRNNSITIDIRHTPTKVLFVSHDGGMAGAQQMLLTLLKGLDRSFVEPVLAVPFKAELAERAATLGILVEVVPLAHWAPCLRFDGRLKRWRYSAKVFIRGYQHTQMLCQLVRRYDIDLIYSNTVTMMEGGLAAKMSNKPHIWHIHEPIAGNNELAQLFPMTFYQHAIRMLVNKVVFPARTLCNDYPLLADKAEVIYNGLDLPELRDREEKKQLLLRQLDLPSDVRLVGVVGAIQPRKDHFNFVLSAKSLLASYDNVRFLIVGTGDSANMASLKAFIEENSLTKRVLLLGRWSGDIADFMAGIDVLVISSEQESFGLTAIEALAVETPVVATRCGGPEEIIEPGVNGFLTPLKAPEALADAVLNILKNEDLGRQLGQRGRTLAFERFTDKLYVNAVHDLIYSTNEQFRPI